MRFHALKNFHNLCPRGDLRDLGDFGDLRRLSLLKFLDTPQILRQPGGNLIRGRLHFHIRLRQPIGDLILFHIGKGFPFPRSYRLGFQILQPIRQLLFRLRRFGRFSFISRLCLRPCAAQHGGLRQVGRDIRLLRQLVQPFRGLGWGFHISQQLRQLLRFRFRRRALDDPLAGAGFFRRRHLAHPIR